MAVDDLFFGNGGGGGDEGIVFFLCNNFMAGIDVNVMIFDGFFFVVLKVVCVYCQYILCDFVIIQCEVENVVIEVYLFVFLVQENIGFFEKNIKNLE